MSQQPASRNTADGPTKEKALQIKELQESLRLSFIDAEVAQTQCHERFRLRGIEAAKRNAARIEPVFQRARKLGAERGLP